MKKYFAFIVSNRLHCFGLGRYKNGDDAQRAAEQYITSKTAEETHPKLLWVVDESEMRLLIGELIMPLQVICQKKEDKKEVEVAQETQEETPAPYQEPDPVNPNPQPAETGL